MDLKLNENFSVELDGRNDLATVNGRAAFEQSVALMVTDYFYRNVLGESKNIEERIKMQATRVAREHDFLDSIRDISVQESQTDVDTYEVELFYTSGDVGQVEIKP